MRKVGHMLLWFLNRAAERSGHGSVARESNLVQNTADVQWAAQPNYTSWVYKQRKSEDPRCIFSRGVQRDQFEKSRVECMHMGD